MAFNFKKIGKSLNKYYNPFSDDFNLSDSLLNLGTSGIMSAVEIGAEASGEALKGTSMAKKFSNSSKGDEGSPLAGPSQSEIEEQERQKERARAMNKQRGSPGRSQSVLSQSSPSMSLLGK